MIGSPFSRIYRQHKQLRGPDPHIPGVLVVPPAAPAALRFCIRVGTVPDDVKAEKMGRFGVLAPTTKRGRAR